MSDTISIISAVKQLEGVGVWNSSNSSSEDACFEPRTLIYGFNGSGKTTLTRVFSSLQPEDSDKLPLPNSVKFNVVLSDGTHLNHDSLLAPSERKFMVYNTDFVEQNIFWNNGESHGIAYIGRDHIEDAKKLSDLTLALGSANELLQDKRSERDTSIKRRDQKMTDIAQQINAYRKGYIDAKPYSAHHVKVEYGKCQIDDKHKLQDSELSAEQNIIQQPSPPPPVKFSGKLPNGIIDWLKGAMKLLNQDKSNFASDAFEFEPDLIQWIREGYKYHNEKNLKTCKFCENRLSENRMAKIAKLFSGPWIEFSQEVDLAVANGQKYMEDLDSIQESVPDQESFPEDLRKKFIPSSSLYLKKINEIKKHGKATLKNIERLGKNPAENFEVDNALRSFNLEKWEQEFNIVLQEMNSMVARQQKFSKEYSEEAEKSYKNIEMHFLFVNKEERDELVEKVEVLEKEVKEMEENVNKLNREVRECESTMQDYGAGASILSNMIGQYLGHKDIELVAEGMGFKLVRSDGEVATSLSEGEKSAIAFCYFLAKIEEGKNKAENQIVVIDDPVSSLDVSARSTAFSYLCQRTKNCAQVVILTHNIAFMSMVKRWFRSLDKGVRKKGKWALLSLDCKSMGLTGKRTTQITWMPKLLANNDSEYHYMYKIVYNAAEKNCREYLFFLPNAIRRVLETFLQFVSPGQPNLYAGLKVHEAKVREKLDFVSLERFAQIGSHSHMISATSLPEFTEDEAIKVARNTMLYMKEVSRVHYNEMNELCSR